MLDAFLAGVRSFGSGYAVRNVANESDMIAAANVRDGEVGVAVKIGLHFDEIGAARRREWTSAAASAELVTTNEG